MCSNLRPMVCDCVFDSKAYICVVKCASTLTPVIVVLLFQLHVIYSNCMYICISYTFMYVHALLQKYRINLHWNKRFYWVFNVSKYCWTATMLTDVAVDNSTVRHTSLRRSILKSRARIHWPSTLETLENIDYTNFILKAESKSW